MARRRLTRQQVQRIRAQQDRRRKRAASGEGTPGPDAGLGPERQGLIIAHYGASLLVEDREGDRFRCTARQNLGPLACGDQVVWQQVGDTEDGVVVAVQPRASLLARPDNAGRERPLAANLDRIIVVAAAFPELSEHLIDRYLVAAELTGIAPAIVLNKMDLADSGALQQLRQRLSAYETIGYPVLYTSVRTEHGLDSLKQSLAGHTSILVGQSGVGKSSLVQALLPQHEIRIGELTDSQLGRHTTTTAELYHLPDGGNLIDSPGVRDFAVWHMDPDRIIAGFREFAPLLGHCRFNDCRHREEPACALHEAAADGRIDVRRLQSYLQIMDEVTARGSD